MANKKSGSGVAKGGPQARRERQAERSRRNTDSTGRWTAIAISIVLVVVGLSLYQRTTGFAYVELDDDLYVSENPHVLAGLDGNGVAWAFTTMHAGNWHPITWLSHMLDITLHGPSPAGAHGTNVLLHLLNALLIFHFLRRTTSALWPSAMVAALFLTHPLNVESVAWVAERKNVLSTFFGLLTLLAYVRYAQQPARWKWYLITCFALVMGLMAKPMLVTLPFVLLLIDHWPLGRWDGSLRSALLLIREKVPLFILVAASSVVTVIAQSKGGALQPLEDLPFASRFGNMLIAYATYVKQTFLPSDLAAYYPYPSVGPSWVLAVGSALLLITISALVWRGARRHAYLGVGWAWFIGTLVPVIGLVQVGGQTMADRYAYVPGVGLFIIIAFGMADLFASRRPMRNVLTWGSMGGLLLLCWTTSTQVGYWRDSNSLFTRALAVTKDNAFIAYNYGVALIKEGSPDKAIAQFDEALRIWPTFGLARYNKGLALLNIGRLDPAIEQFERSLKADPDDAQVLMNMGVAWARKGDRSRAASFLEAALKQTPDNAAAHTNLGLILLDEHKMPEAMKHLERAVALDPRSPEAANNLGLALLSDGRPQDAMGHFRTAIRLAPNYAMAQDNLAKAEHMLEQNAPAQARP